MEKKQEYGETRIRKINAVLTGDSAVDAELLIVKLCINDGGKKKADVDAELVAVALDALNVVIDAAKSETGNKHPSIDDVRDILQKRLIVAEN